MLLDHLDVGHQPGSRVVALQQVMAEDRVLRDPVPQRRREGIDLVDALAGERPLSEQVLVDVGDGERVGIQALPGGVDRLEERGVLLGRQRGGDPGRQDRVPARHPPRTRVEPCPVQRVRELRDQLLRRSSGQDGVGIQGDHVAERAGQPALDRRVARVLGPTEQDVELVELAALALPAHPHAFPGVVLPFAVEQEEPVPVACVEASDP